MVHPSSLFAAPAKLNEIIALVHLHKGMLASDQQCFLCREQEGTDK
jgi:hypothetical protein